MERFSPPEIDPAQFWSQIPPTWYLGAILLAVLLIFLPFLLHIARKSRPGSFSGNRRHGSTFFPFTQPKPAENTNMADPRAQIEAVSQVAFEPVRLLNREEAPLLPLLERCISGLGQGHRVMAQTSLGELIRPRRGSADAGQARRAFASINSKRLDFAIIDRRGYLVCAVEYQGSGHYHRESFMRDAVKREALRKAGIAFVEVPHGYTADEVRWQVKKALAPAGAAADARARR